jgi:hypothetical protein
MMARRVRSSAALLVAGMLALAGCSESATFPADLAGSFRLASANGQALPYALPGAPAGTSVVLLDGALVIFANGRFEEILHYRLTTPEVPAGQVSTSQTIGSASVSGGNITFSARFEDGFSGTISASGVTYTKAANGVSLAFNYVRTN